MPRPSLGPNHLFPLAFLALAILLAVFTAGTPLRDEISMMLDWRGAFEKYQDLGNNCKVAFFRSPASDSPDEALLEIGRKQAESFLVPFRREKKYVTLPPENNAYTSCAFQVHAIDPAMPGYIYLGPIWGDTRVYVNGHKVRTSRRISNLTIPVLPEWLDQPLMLEILSINRGELAGPLSLIPLSYLPNDGDVRIVERTLRYFSTERYLVPIGVYGAMTLLFMCCWIFGVRYRDVYWMIMATALAAATAGMGHHPVSESPPYLDRIQNFIQMLSSTALCMAIYTFLRKPASQLKLIGIFIGVGLLYSVQFALPQSVIQATVGYIGRHDDIPLGICLLVLAYLAGKTDPEIPPRRLAQRRALGFILLPFGLTILWAGFYQFRVGVTPATLMRTSMIAIFGTFMIIDLVVFQRAYFEEKSLKEEEERRRSALEDRLELGQSIQRLLMPQKTEASFGPFRVHVYFESAEQMAGDWFTWWEQDQRFRLFCGDVVGKGPQAAIASTSILTSCRNFSYIHKDLSGLLSALNASVRELFNQLMVSTIAALELTVDGKVTVTNNGFAGWIHLHGDEATLIPQRGPSLGAKDQMDWQAVSVDLAPGDRLLIFSDGVAEGPRAIKKICELAAKSHRGMTLPALAQRLIEAGAASAVVDDRTLMMIERT